MSSPEERRGPLAGVRVVDLSAVVSGPMAAGILADQGADVVKIETRGGDLTRRIGPAKGDVSALYVAINRGKRSVVLDLKQDAGRRVLRELVERADVLIENFRPGAMDRLGFGPAQTLAWNPRLVYLSISGFGPDGPNAGQRVYDPVIQAASGFAAAHPDPATGEPRLLPTLMCDKITSLTAAQAVTAALVERGRTGVGRHVTLSMLDAAVSFLWPEGFYNHGFLDEPPPAAPEFGASQKLWRAKDGWFAMITPQDDEFVAMCTVLGRPELFQDPRFCNIHARRTQQATIHALLSPLVAEQPVGPLVARLAAAGVPVGHVNLKTTLQDDPQLKHNGGLVDVEHPGLGRVRSPRPAARFGDEAPNVDRGAHLGEHTREVLSELGRSEADIDALVASGAAG